ncbi:MAG: hypothetical protein WD025_03705 [Bacteriovoracaceae bacterium]
MLSCKEIFKLANDQDKKPLFLKMEIAAHMLMCKHCARYRDHIKIMSENLQKLHQKQSDSSRENIQEIEKKTLEELKKRA